MIRLTFYRFTLIIFIFHFCGKCVKTTDKCVNCVNDLLLQNQNQVKNKTFENKYENKSSISESLQSIEQSFVNFNEIKTKILSNLSPIENNLKRSGFQFIKSLNLTNECFSAIFRWFEALKRTEMWAFEFFDASGRIPSGLLEGVISSFGEYDQCLGIKSQSINKQNEIIYGKYCLVKPILPLNDFKILENFNGFEFLDKKTNEWINEEIKENINKIKLLMVANQKTNNFYAFYYGICIPSQCQPKDVQNFFKAVIPPIIPIPIEVGPKCDTIDDKIERNLFNTLVFAIPLILVVLVIISTFYSLKYRNPIQQKNNYFHEIMKSFSLIESNKRLFTPFKDRILIVDLLFLWFVFWISTSIAYSAMVGSGSVGFKKLFSSYAIHVLTETKYFWLRTPFPRDSFFLFSGIIISSEFFAKNVRMSLLSYLKFVFEKWYQFIPKMIGSILIFNILTNIGDGPIFSMETSKNVCPKGIWKNFLLVHQFVYDMSDMCAPGTWVYGVIFQLYVISPLFMLPFIKSFKFGLIFNIFAIIVFSFVKIIPKLFFGLQLIPFEVKKASIKVLKESFIRSLVFTDQYINIFIFGIIIGYLLRKRPQMINKLTKTKTSIIIFSILSYSMTILSVAWSENFKDINEDKNQLNLIAWFVLGNLLWSIGIIWTIFLFFQNEHGILHWIMTTRVFYALVRMTLPILANFGIINGLLAFMKRYTVVTSHLNQTKTIYNDMSLTIFASYMVYILLEYPIVRLFEIITTRTNVILLDKKKVANNNEQANELERMFYD